MKDKGLYILRCKVTDKCYVGMSTGDCEGRVKRHLSGKEAGCRLIHRAVLKHGADAFTVEYIPLPNLTDEEISREEHRTIIRVGTLSPHGYNLTEGGEGCVPSDETRAKMSAAQKARWDTKTDRELTLEHRAKIKEANRRRWGCPKYRAKVQARQHIRGTPVGETITMHRLLGVKENATKTMAMSETEVAEVQAVADEMGTSFAEVMRICVARELPRLKARIRSAKARELATSNNEG